MPLQNLDLLIQYEKSRLERGLGPLNIHINFLIQKINWMEIGNTYDFGITKGVKSFRTFLYDPSHLSLMSLELKEREQILDYYFRSLSSDQLLNSMRILLPLLESVPKIVRGSYLLELREKSARYSLAQSL